MFRCVAKNGRSVADGIPETVGRRGAPAGLSLRCGCTVLVRLHALYRKGFAIYSRVAQYNHKLAEHAGFFDVWCIDDLCWSLFCED